MPSSSIQFSLQILFPRKRKLYFNDLLVIIKCPCVEVFPTYYGKTANSMRMSSITATELLFYFVHFFQYTHKY